MSKVLTTNRILIKGGVVYVSSEIIRDVKEDLIRLNQKYGIKRDRYYSVIDQLRELCKNKPEHFMKSSREVMANL